MIILDTVTRAPTAEPPRDLEATLRALRDRYDSLSAREREVMARVVSGRPNKQIGDDLGISEITVKAHRGRVMRKMKARSLVDLVHMALGLGLTRSPWLACA